MQFDAEKILENLSEWRKRDEDPALYDFTHLDTIRQAENRIYAGFEIVINRPGVSRGDRYDAQVRAIEALMEVYCQKRHGYSAAHLRTAFLHKRAEMAARLKLNARQLASLDRLIEAAISSAASFTAGGRGVPILPAGSRAPVSVKVAYDKAHADYLDGTRHLADLPERDRVKAGDDLTDRCRLRIFEAWAEYLLTLDVTESDFDEAIELAKKRVGELSDWRLIEAARSTTKAKWRQMGIDRETTRADAAAENVKPILNEEALPDSVRVNEPPQDTPRTKDPVVAANLPPWAAELRRLREEKQFSRPMLAREMKTSLGVTITAESIKKHEEGKHCPLQTVREAYANYYGVEEQKIFTR